MNQLQTKYKDAEDNYGSNFLNFLRTSEYLTRLTDKRSVRCNPAQHYSNILDTFELVVNTLSIDQEIEDARLYDEDDSDKYIAIKDGHETQYTPDMLSNKAAHL